MRAADGAGAGAAAPSARSLHVLMPGDVRDAGSPSGGNAYDLRMCRELAAAGWTVHEVPLPGAWPRPSAADRDRLDRALGELPDGAPVLLDGLVACGVPATVAPHARRLRLAVLLHLPLADETGLDAADAADLEALEGRTLRAARAVIATSRWAARDAALRHGLGDSRVHAVRPGTDPAPLARGSGGAAPRLLCVAALTPRKGQDVLTAALAKSADLPWTCEFVGPLDRDPDFAAHVRDMIARAGLSGRVLLSGPRTGAALESSYDAADLFVLASHAETYGMVLTEALARGIPVLATSAGAVPDTVGRASDGNVPGILVPPGDSAALAGALRSWLTVPAIHRDLTTCARDRRAGLQGWPEVSRHLSDVLEGLRL